MKIKAQPFVDDFRVKLNVSDAAKQAKSDDGHGIVITLDATHGGYINRNFYFYSVDGMKKSVDSWTKPYNKPMLVHHRMSDSWGDKATDPIGRITDAKFIKDGEQGFIRLTAHITDADAIQKIKDKRYLTVSTSQRPVGPVMCSVCGTDLLQERCDHYRGKKYIIEGDEEQGTKDEVKLCYYIFSDMEYRECSPVNEPGDQSDSHAAQIISWTAMDSINDADPTEDIRFYSKEPIAHDGTLDVAADAMEVTLPPTPETTEESTEDESTESTDVQESTEEESTEEENTESTDVQTDTESKDETEKLEDDSTDEGITALMDILDSKAWR